MLKLNDHTKKHDNSFMKTEEGKEWRGGQVGEKRSTQNGENNNAIGKTVQTLVGSRCSTFSKPILAALSRKH